MPADEPAYDAIADILGRGRLERFKTRARVDPIRSLTGDSGLASQLVVYQTLAGDWRELFTHVDWMATVTKADIRRVAA